MNVENIKSCGKGTFVTCCSTQQDALDGNSYVQYYFEQSGLILPSLDHVVH